MAGRPNLFLRTPVTFTFGACMAFFKKFSRRPSALVAYTVVGAYTLALAGLYLRQRELLYRAPRANQCADHPTEVVPKCSLGPTLHGWVDNPGQANALIYFGGSSESVELRRQALAQAFPNHTRYFVPYRGFWPNRPKKTKDAQEKQSNRVLKSVEADIKSDARRTFACIAKLHDNVDVLGRSLGTGVALHVAAHENVRRLGLITPYDSIIDIAQSRYKWMPVKYMLRDRFESWRDAMKVRAPIFAILAETDPVTPHKCWENLKRHLNTTVGVATAPNTDHSNIVDSPVTWNELQNFFNNGVISSPKINTPKR